MFDSFHENWTELKTEAFSASKDIVENFDWNRWFDSAWCGSEKFTVTYLRDAHCILLDSSILVDPDLSLLP